MAKDQQQLTLNSQLSLVPPMTGPEIREAVISILSDIAPDENFASMKDEVSFRDQFEMDSMDLLDIVLELRNRYRVQIPEEDYPKLDNMNSTVEYLLPLMNP
jgi:acyl carrier protein